MSYVFVSYSTKNSQYAQRLVEKLYSEGFNVWIDNEQLRASNNWWEAIVLALKSADAIIVIMTPESRVSRWVQREAMLAENWRIPAFPLLMAGENWELFVTTQFEDVRGKPGSASINLPSAHFFDQLAKHVTRQRQPGSVVMSPIQGRILKADPSVAAAIANPPPNDERQSGRRVTIFTMVLLTLGAILALIPGLPAILDARTPLPSIVVASTQKSTDPPTKTSLSLTRVAATSESPTHAIPSPSVVLTTTPKSSATITSTPTALVMPTLDPTNLPGRTLTATDARVISTSNAATVREVRVLRHAARVNDLAFSPDGNRLAAVDLNSSIRLWDVWTGDVLRVWEKTGVWLVAFSADGTLIAGGSTDNNIYIWDARTGDLVRTLQGHTAAIASLAFNPTCSESLTCDNGLASGGFDNRIRLWNLGTGNSEVMSGHVNPVVTIAYNPNGRTVTTGSYSGAMMEWNLQTRRQIGVLRAHTGTIAAISYSQSCVPLGSGCTYLMASSGDDRRIILWDAISSQKLAEIRNNHTASINDVSFEPDGRLLAASSSDFTVRLLDIVNNRELVVLNGHTDSVMAVAVDPTGRLVASGSADGTIRLWAPR